MILIDTDDLSVLSNRRSSPHANLVQRMSSSPDQEFAIPGKGKGSSANCQIWLMTR